MLIAGNEWAGYDTETFEGRAVLCCTESRSLLFPKSAIEIFDWLLEQPGCRYATWNLDYDIQASIATLPADTLAKLATVGKVKLPEGEGYLLEYLAGKEFKVTRGKGKTAITIALYDGLPFVQKSLASASESLLGARKKLEIPSAWYTEMQARLDDPMTRDTIIDYCKRDSATALEIVAKIGESFASIGVDFSRPLSPGYLAGQVFGNRIPTLTDEFQQSYLHSYYGGRVEIHRRGKLGPCVGYDIRSAYPAVMSKLRAIEHTERTDTYTPDAVHGSYLLSVGLTEPLLPYRPLSGGTILYPVGHWVDWYSRPMLEMLMRRGAEFEVIAAIESWADGDLLFPEFPEWYKLRKTDPVRGIAYKLILNSAYGKTAETVSKVCKVRGNLTSHDIIVGGKTGGLYRRYDAPGRFTNFAMAAHITSAVQARLTEAAMSDPARVALLATDGILFEGTAPAPGVAPLGAALGEWDGPSPSDAAVIVGCGFYSLLQQSKWDTKSRGVVPRGEFKDWFSPEDCYLRIKGLRGESLREAARRGDYSRLNWLRETVQRKNVNADTKRDWSGSFKTARDCLERSHSSNPFVVWEVPKESRARLKRQGRLPAGIKL